VLELVNEEFVGVRELDDCCGSIVVSYCCEKLVAEAREQFGNPQRKGNVRRWKPLPSNGLLRL
jgi:hypothetical protein